MPVLGKMGCALCKVKAARYLFKIRIGLPMSLVSAEARFLCVVFSGYSAKVCAGVIGHGQPLKVLQLADVHLQLDYAYGSNVNCKNKLFCCRARDGFPKMHKLRAGMWGTYEKCDTPPALLVSLLHHVRATHPDVAYILWSGDNSAHNVHEVTRRQTVAANQAVTDLLRRVFPRALVLPAVGNHDSHPVNSFPPPTLGGRFSNSWLFSALRRMWRPLLDGRLGGGRRIEHSFEQTFHPYGYYYVRVCRGTWGKTGKTAKNSGAGRTSLPGWTAAVICCFMH
ncbi:Sphingomyelin phosphodiesterase [Amphibalanus amphitrite]|uniref:Sphingomyelin phosphodiesterase n=1 Tax=Amphibalanus amphitrite TaxID=1232801 RepID=A0A6A4XBR6_AMPAM|nr:Sphingomyelin phosphodiesterase [Amphibalanus amphitrite]